MVPPDAPRRIIATTTPARLYHLIADESVVKPASFAGTLLLQAAVTNILLKYTEDFYRVRRERWESNQMVYRTLDESDPNLSFNRGVLKEGKDSRYVVKILGTERQLVSAVKELIADAEALYRKETAELPRIHFDRHLYQPLLLDHGDKVKMTPPGLNESEAHFVSDLKEYWDRDKDDSMAGLQVFLLRNLSRGSGIGFFEERRFYPDFILWVVDSMTQHIVFIEPHGMLHAEAYQYDKKVQLHKRLPELAKEIGRRSGQKKITLDSYIISATPYQDLRKRYDDGSWNMEKFATAHILFMERSDEYDYMERIFRGKQTRR